MTHIDYTSKDFLSLRDQMVATARDRLPEWTASGSADFALAIIEAVAYMGDILSYTSDRVLNESFLSTAVQRSSVLDIARMLGYEPQGPAAATVTLSFGVDTSSGDVTIPAGTRVSTNVTGSTENVVFETNEEVTVTQASGSSTVTVLATEGTSVNDEVVGVATTEANQTYSLAFAPVVEDSLVVEVDEGAGYRLWVYFPHILDADSNTPAYTFHRDAEGGVILRFGDGVDGRVPAQGSPIRVSYRVGGGEKGNVAARTITTLLDGVQGVTSVQNLAAASGGEDHESIEDIRSNAPTASRTGERAVTLRDFRDLAAAVPGVAHTSAESDVSTSVIVYAAPTGPNQPALSAGLRSAVEAELADKAMLGTTATVLGPTYVPIDVSLDVTVDDTYSQSDVVTRVEAEITNLYALANVDFAKTLPVSDLYRAISTVEGVLYLIVTQHERDYATGDPLVVSDSIEHAIDELPYLNSATITPFGGIVVA